MHLTSQGVQIHASIMDQCMAKIEVEEVKGKKVEVEEEVGKGNKRKKKQVEEEENGDVEEDENGEVEKRRGRKTNEIMKKGETKKTRITSPGGQIDASIMEKYTAPVFSGDF